MKEFVEAINLFVDDFTLTSKTKISLSCLDVYTALCNESFSEELHNNLRSAYIT